MCAIGIQCLSFATVAWFRVISGSKDGQYRLYDFLKYSAKAKIDMKSTFYSVQLKRIAEERGVEHLFHFTPFENAKNILEKGLLSRAALEKGDTDFYITDPERRDGYPQAICVSVDSINREMLKRKKLLLSCKWLYVVISPEVLWTHDCHFCYTNAASSVFKYYWRDLHKPEAFARMFEDRPLSFTDPRSKREVSGMSKGQPTDIQAEVQVFDPINIDLVVGFLVEDDDTKRKLEVLMAHAQVAKEIVVLNG